MSKTANFRTSLQLPKSCEKNLRFVATIEGGINFDKGFRTFRTVLSLLFYDLINKLIEIKFFNM